MAGEADTQLDIQPKEGLHFYTFELRDELGREVPGQMEAPSEEAVRNYLGERGYDLLDIRQGWYALRMKQSVEGRREAVESRLSETVETALGRASRAEAVVIRLDPAADRATMSEVKGGVESVVAELAPDVYPALRKRFAELAGLRPRRYEERCEGKTSESGREVDVTIEGNRTVVRVT